MSPSHKNADRQNFTYDRYIEKAALFADFFKNIYPSGQLNNCWFFYSRFFSNGGHELTLSDYIAGRTYNVHGKEKMQKKSKRHFLVSVLVVVVSLVSVMFIFDIGSRRDAALNLLNICGGFVVLKSTSRCVA